MRTTAMLKIKNELRLCADLIRAKRKHFRETVSRLSKSGGNTSTWHNKDLRELTTQLARLQHEFRHKHIAFCLLRGRGREQIETPAKDNPPNEDVIAEKLSEYMAAIAKETQEVSGETLRARQS